MGRPHGDVLATWGIPPIFAWAGSSGYRRFGTPWANVYVRARHYDPATGRWVSMDPLWPAESAGRWV